MADNVVVSAGTGTTVAADEVIDATLGTVKVQYVKLMDGTLDGSTKATVGAGGLKVDPTSSVAVGTGVRSSTTQRVTIATDDSLPVTNAGTFAVQAAATLAAETTKVIGTVNLAAAQTLATVTNLATINSVAPAFGDGVKGATVLRTTLATDSPGIIATGSQASPSASYLSTVAAGDIAHDAADSGNPAKVGAKAIAGLSTATLVAAADRTQLYAGLDGALITRPHCGLEDLISGVAAITDGSSTSVIASAGAGVKNYITSVMIANTSATAVTVDLRDGAAGTVKATLPVPANTSGVVCNFPVPLGFSAATAVCADPSATATTITVTLLGFKSKV